MKNSRNDIGSIGLVITHLQRAIEHYDFMDAKEVSIYIQGIIDELELFEPEPTAPDVISDQKKAPKKTRHRSGSAGKREPQKYGVNMEVNMKARETAFYPAARKTGPWRKSIF